MGERLIFARKASGLVKELTAFDVVVWAVSVPAIIGFLYFAPRSMYLYGDLAIYLAYIAGFLMCLPMALTIASAVAAMPRAGGVFPIMSRVLPPSLTYLITWIYLLDYGFINGVVNCVAILMFGSSLIYYGTLTANSVAIGTGRFLLSNIGIITGAVILIVIEAILTLFGMKIVKWLQRVLFIVPLIILGLMIGALYINAPYYNLLFNNIWGPGVSERIIAKATELGFTQPAFSWDKLGSAFFVALYAFGGFEVVTTVSGEVKSPRRALWIGFVAGLVCVTILYIITAGATATVASLVNSYSYLYYTNRDALSKILPNPGEPSLLFFASAAIPTWLAVLLPPFILLWIVKATFPTFVGNSRVIFSLAMDRLFPIHFAHVNRFGSPTWAIILQLVLSLLGLYVFTMNIGAILALLTWAGYIHFWLFGLGMLIFPYARKDVFEKSPIQWKIGGIPIISILGLATFAIGFFIFCYTLREIPFEAILMVILLALVGIIIHMYQLWRNEKEGISLSDIYAELPPA